MNLANILLVVACAVFRSDREVLLSNRPTNKSHVGLWEFPGGKVELGETPEEALARELFEELSITVRPDSLIPITFVSHPYEDFHLLMPFYVCHRYEGVPQECEGQKIKWIILDDLTKYPMLPADGPLVSVLQNYSHKHKD
ncbi:MAG: (deoxy)nucleoside triphosphate pyrophosphohydrolase [Candidatus Liberibacter ctenarytainae]|uniref:8-oxo-dGTP diphosphatase n=1 Tax=Candidatus Liberibacter ctenarytainae TaxID=2020335 RepID=A0A937DLG1_9HYPH|nr:(deoxy)nucleoside triphosphate pyrophosphohydrolase [Candidatus Liberibacter ctenarytainae]